MSRQAHLDRVQEKEAFPRAAAKQFPLSLAQENLWLQHQKSEGSSDYHLAGAFRIQGVLDGCALESSFSQVLERHEMLRTSFGYDDGGPYQVIHPSAAFHLEVVDIRADHAGAQLSKVLRAYAARPFDLTRPPLLRAALFAMTEEDTVLCIVIHHIVADGWSLRILADELAHSYPKPGQGRPQTLPELDFQYVDYAVWQRRVVAESTAGVDGMAFWRGKLTSTPNPVELPFRATAVGDAPSKDRARGEATGFRVSGQLRQRLRQLGANCRSSPFAVLLAAFVILLWKHTKQNRLAIWVPMADRREAWQQKIIGMLVHMAPCTVSPEGSLSGSALLAAVQEELLELNRHQHVPADAISVLPGEGSSPLPRPAWVFSWDEAMPRLQLGELTAEAIEISPSGAKFELALNLVSEAEGLKGRIEFDGARYSVGAMDALSQRYLEVLDALCRDPEERLDRLAWLPESELAQLRAGQSRNRVREVEMPGVVAAIRERAIASPSRLAVRDGNTAYTYAELMQRGSRIARRLQSAGLTQNEVVGVALDRGAPALASMLGVLMAGFAYVYLDPTYPQNRVQRALEQTKARAVLTSSVLASRFATESVSVYIEGDGDAREDESSVADWPITAPDPDSLAYILYTSGSTGRPKGVQITHRGLANLCEWHREAFRVSVEDRVAQTAAFSFDASVWEVWSTLTAGASLFLPEEKTRIIPAELLAWTREKAITLAFFPTPMAEHLLQEPEIASLPLRLLLTGGDRFQAAREVSLPFPLINNYGPTECAVVATSGVLRRQGRRWMGEIIGQPIRNTSVYVLNQDLEQVPPGDSGELYIGGAGLARGYAGDPTSTAANFVPDPWGAPGSRMYRSGDLARLLPDGEVEFLGRKDEQIKIKGFRIEPAEVERALLQTPGVKEAAVTAADSTGRTERTLVAYFTTLPEQEVTLEQIFATAHAWLPDYMVPAYLVKVDKLPWTENGKVDRAALQTLAIAAQSTLGAGDLAGLTGAERTIAALWHGLTGVSIANRDMDFLRLGGSSLMATQLMLRVNAEFGTALGPRTWFDHPTLRAFAAAVEAVAKGSPASEQSPIRKVDRAR